MHSGFKPNHTYRRILQYKESEIMAATISAGMVKELREKSGAGMMDCKKALTEANGDMDAAMKALREKGIAKGEKRADRVAAEGLVSFALNDNQTAGALAELNSETDFVARNDEFQACVKEFAEVALAEKTESAEALAAKTAPTSGKTINDVVTDLVARIGEKIELSAAGYLEGDVVTGYIHPPGKIGVIIAAKLDGAEKNDTIKGALRDAAMHIAASAPRFLKEDEVDQATMDNEREIYRNIALKEGKPENIVDKIVDGKMKSFYKDHCLVAQLHVMDNKKTVKQVLDEAAKEAGGKIEITGFHRFAVGEKAEKPEE